MGVLHPHKYKSHTELKVFTSSVRVRVWTSIDSVTITNEFNKKYLKGIAFYEHRLLRYVEYKINKHDFVSNDELSIITVVFYWHGV
jgi:hypothetical protein